MTNILHIDSSVTGQASISRQLSRAIVARLTGGDTRTTVTRRDLAADPLPYLDVATLGLIRDPDAAGEGQHSSPAERSSAEFLEADAVVIGVPMYNFGIPAQLKTWVDHLSIPGVTFRHTANGPEGLAGGRRVILASSRGARYGQEYGNAATEHQESYMLAVLSFLGVTDIEIVRAEGVRMGAEAAEAAEAALRGAYAKVAALTPAASRRNADD